MTAREGDRISEIRRQVAASPAAPAAVCARSRALLFIALLQPAFLGGQSRGGATGEEGNFCVRDYLPNASCTAFNAHVETLVPQNVVGHCWGDGVGQVDVILDVWMVTANGLALRDIGIFLALDGSSALSGDNCYHDFLAPPLTESPNYVYENGYLVLRNGPWWDADGFLNVCGDIAGDNSEPLFAVKTERTAALPLTLACTDTNDDGNLDLSVCLSWAYGTSSGCDGVSDAFPPLPTYCDCQQVEVTGLPVPLCSPGAIEACDGLDNTCDGEIDEGLPACIFFDGVEYGDTSHWSSP